jgi:hypothetical protein
MVHAVRVLLERGYPERGFTKGRRFGAPQLKIQDILQFDRRKDAKHIG